MRMSKKKIGKKENKQNAAQKIDKIKKTIKTRG